MNTQTKNDYLKPVPISTGDLMKTFNRLDELLTHPGVKGLLALSEISHPVYIAMPKNPSQEHRHYAIRIVLILASMGGLFSHIQAINNEKSLPPEHTAVDAHPDTEERIKNDFYDRYTSSYGVANILCRTHS